MGNKYYCPDCGNIFNGEYLRTDLYSRYEMPCPISNCNGNAFEIDDLMIPVIKVLNEKGYTTKFCCSGHYDHDVSFGYLWFEEWVELPNIPKGFSIDKDIKVGICIRPTRAFNRTLSHKPTYNDFYSICDEAKSLLKWATALPEVEY